MDFQEFQERDASIQWALEGLLAHSPRPGFPVVQPDAEAVRQWIDAALEAGIRSILCILEPEQLAYYDWIGLDGGGLLDYYRKCGLSVAYIPATDHKMPPLSEEELAKVWEEFEALEKPILVHCNAGIDRTGAAVQHILGELEQGFSINC